MPPLVDCPWPRRLNRDGTTDSICPTCFQTIAHTRLEEELAEAERLHECSGAPVPPPYRRWLDL
jgi:hypothetical protein